MRSMEVTDEWLYQYMPVVDNAMIKALEGQVDEDYVFSKRFERKMKKVIRHEAHPMLTGAQQLLKRVAIFFHRYRMRRAGSDVKCGCLSG